MRIIVSPYSRELDNAKNYPYWYELINELKDDFDVIQVGRKGEPVIKVGTKVLYDMPLKELEALTKTVGLWVSVDNFFPHMADYIGVKGVGLFGPSDPDIFGHSSNVNLLKSREFLRKDQFGFYKGWKWEHADKGWVQPTEVINAINNLSK